MTQMSPVLLLRKLLRYKFPLNLSPSKTLSTQSWRDRRLSFKREKRLVLKRTRKLKLKSIKRLLSTLINSYLQLRAKPKVLSLTLTTPFLIFLLSKSSDSRETELLFSTLSLKEVLSLKMFFIREKLMLRKWLKRNQTLKSLLMRRQRIQKRLTKPSSKRLLPPSFKTTPLLLFFPK